MLHKNHRVPLYWSKIKFHHATSLFVIKKILQFSNTSKEDPATKSTQPQTLNIYFILLRNIFSQFCASARAFVHNGLWQVAIHLRLCGDTRGLCKQQPLFPKCIRIRRVHIIYSGLSIEVRRAKSDTSAALLWVRAAEREESSFFSSQQVSAGVWN